ncbi:VOC family protein [Nesterenkonia xinjiangensis]|uniref:Putative enzyme related to lactoylglutathione lyase n=1 Tax=Nesterenkonia xinjiangensis TaxID=225327 RepID=A0A7Z0GLJ7_9MICC|nr:VOC family protein [Nesterenkonia xinjiangensis]NYJ78239.1 putative enzyme related to lactoylglutathione lyase [Nesterenkonia xinjiangensis]
MSFIQQIVVLDAADVEAVASFWAGVHGGTVRRPDPDWYEVEVDGTFPLAVQHAPDHVRPQWPDGRPQQIHLDLYVEDIRAEHERVMALGAELLQSAEDLDAETGFQVYADPAGHPFCLCWGWNAWRAEMDG